MKVRWVFLLFTFSFADFGSPKVPFLLISPTARTTSLFGFTAIADDASATFYNPAGLAFQNSLNVSGTYSNWLLLDQEKIYAELKDISGTYSNWLPDVYPGMHYLFLAGTNPLRQGQIGGNFIYLNTGKVEVINSRGEYLGEYTPYDWTFTISYGHRILPKLGFGLSGKFIYSLLIPEWVWERMPELGITSGGTGTSWGVDLGILYKPLPWLNLGASINNISPGISYIASGESYQIPTILRFGINLIRVRDEDIKINIPIGIEFGLNRFYLNSREIANAGKGLGIEMTLYNLINFRLTYSNDWQPVIFHLERRGGLSLGIGLQWESLAFDVGWEQLKTRSDWIGIPPWSQEIYKKVSNWKFSLSYKR
jgi:hypothetical protein